MDGKSKDKESYLQDLREIRELTARYEERPMVEYWDFLSWGILIILGTVLHTLFFPAHLNRALLVIWLPVVIVGGTVETVAWFYVVSRLEMPLSSRRNRRFYLAVLMIFTAVCVVFYYVIHLDGPVPGMILLLVSILFALIAQSTFMALFVETALLLAAGIILTVLDLEGRWIGAGTGLFVGLQFLALGFHSRILEKKNG